MRVITRKTLRAFWTVDKAAEEPLRDWEKKVKANTWLNWGELKQTFGSVDRVGFCTVFDVGNNRWRLIARINFEKGRVFVLKVMAHAEYDKRDPKNKAKAAWVDECRCQQPPPNRKGRR